MAEHRTLDLAAGGSVAALLDRAPQPFAQLVLAHGAGAGMDHPFMAAVAAGLAGRGVTTWRYQFPYMQAGSKRPDRPAVAHATVRAAAAAAALDSPGLPLFAGGKSFGARMTSQAQAALPLPSVAGLVFFGFPLHPAKQPGAARAAHLDQVGPPMLFLQGTRDALAEFGLLQPVIDGLGGRAVLHAVPGADHAFHVPARSGRTDAEVLADMVGVAAGFMRQVLRRPAP